MHSFCVPSCISAAGAGLMTSTSRVNGRPHLEGPRLLPAAARKALRMRPGPVHYAITHQSCCTRCPEVQLLPSPQVFGRAAFEEARKYFRFLHFTTEDERSTHPRVLRFSFNLPPADRVNDMKESDIGACLYPDAVNLKTVVVCCRCILFRVSDRGLVNWTIAGLERCTASRMIWRRHSEDWSPTMLEAENLALG